MWHILIGQLSCTAVYKRFVLVFTLQHMFTYLPDIKVPDIL